MNNLPIYRAKHINSDEYVIGYYIYNKDENIHYVFNDTYFYLIKTQWCHEGVDMEQFIEIDPTTLSIHFDGMLDSQGNKIFASLQENGRGGDIIEYKGRQYTFGYKKEYFKVGLLNFRGWQLTTSDLLKVKTIAIQE